MPPWLLWLIIGTGVLLGIAGGKDRGREPDAARWGPAVLLAALLLYFAAWSFPFNIRNKDVRLVQPLMDALVAVGLWRIVGVMRNLRPRALRGRL